MIKLSCGVFLVLIMMFLLVEIRGEDPAPESMALKAKGKIEEMSLKFTQWLWQSFDTEAYPHKESACLNDHKAGTLTSEKVKQMGSSVRPSVYKDGLNTWAERTTFFPYTNRAKMTLQGYSMLQEECSSKPLLFFGVGFTESTVKYAHVMNALFEQGGYDIYSFDYRGQGFSQHAVWDEVRGMRVSHVESFDDNAQDLKDFMGYIKSRDEERCAGSNSSSREASIYVGNSMGGLLGYYTQRFYSDLLPADAEEEGSTSNKLFSKLLLMAPCIEPYGLGVPLVYVLHFLHWVTPDWWRSQIFFVLAAMDVDNNHLSHDLTFLNFWDDLRHAGSRWLIVYGPSLNFLRELVNAGYRALTEGENEVIKDTDIFVVMSEEDKLIDISVAEAWWDQLTAEGERRGERRWKQIPGTYHEIWAEGEQIVETVVEAALTFFDS